jgi:hypothetical protein
MNPFKIILSGGKHFLKGIQWILNRPETSIAALVLPGLGYAKAALVLKYMIEAEDKFSSSGSGPTKLRWVMKTIRLLEKQGVVPDIGLNDGELAKYIAALVPAAEAKGMLVEIEPEDPDA